MPDTHGNTPESRYVADPFPLPPRVLHELDTSKLRGETVFGCGLQRRFQELRDPQPVGAGFDNRM